MTEHHPQQRLTDVNPWTRIAGAVRSEVALARLAIGVVALHVVDDSFLQPNPGTSAGDHLFGGLVPLAAARRRGGVLRPPARRSARDDRAPRRLLRRPRRHGGDPLHAWASARPATTTPGLLSVPAGLTLLGLGAVTLWRSRRRDDRLWWRYGRRLLITAGVLVRRGRRPHPVTVSYVVTHAARDHVPAADLGAAYEEVEFERATGSCLKGWYIESQNGAAVISFPGRARSQKRAKLLARHGYGVLLFDRRGEGESEGDPNLFGWQGERDVHAAVEFLQGRPDVDPERIGGIGLSVGGEMMIEAAAESTALKAIVSEGASGRSVRDELANPGGRWQELIGNGVATAATALFTDNVPPADLQSLVPKISGAVFFVYGERGQAPEQPANDAFYAAANGTKEIWEVPGSGHMGGIEAQPREYERRIVGFFDRTLLGER